MTFLKGHCHSSGCLITYDTCTIIKCYNFTYLKLIISNHVLNLNLCLEINNKKTSTIYYVIVHYDVIDYIYIYNSRKNHFEKFVDNYKIMNDFIMFSNILMHFTCQILAKSNNSSIRRRNATKVELDLCYIKTYSLPHLMSICERLTEKCSEK